MRLKGAQRLENETESSDRQGSEPENEPVSTTYNDDVIIDLECVGGVREPGNMRRMCRPPLWCILRHMNLCRIFYDTHSITFTYSLSWNAQ